MATIPRLGARVVLTGLPGVQAVLERGRVDVVIPPLAGWLDRHRGKPA